MASKTMKNTIFIIFTICLPLILTSCTQVDKLVFGEDINPTVASVESTPASNPITEPPAIPVVEPEPPIVITPTIEYEIWVLMGQSNMELNHDMNFDADPQIQMAGSWPDGRAGAGYAFALKRKEKVKNILLIQCAIGGTPIERWTVGGDLYEYCKTQMEPYLGQITGVLYAQGEADASKSYPETWKAKFEAMATDVTAFVGRPIPIIFNQLGQFYFPGWPTPTYRDHIRQEQANVSLPNVQMVVTENVQPAEGWHYSKNEMLIIGRKMEEKLEVI